MAARAARSKSITPADWFMPRILVAGGETNNVRMRTP